MKKTLAIILALVMLFALCACGQQAASGSANQSVSQQGSAGSPKQDIADAAPAEKPAEAELKHVKMGLSMQSLKSSSAPASTLRPSCPPSRKSMTPASSTSPTAVRFPTTQRVTKSPI